jgi:peptidyl-prolyl cis-trans isomerase SurA
MMWKSAVSAFVLNRLDNARGVSGGSVIKHACLLAATIGCLTAAAPAHAQVVLFVNGDPITNFDIEQRGKLVQLTLHKTVPRDELINDLIDDKIKISVGKRYRIEITESDVDKQFAEMGTRIRMSKSQFEQVLTQAGVEPDTMKEHIKAEISWATIVQGKFQARLLVNEKDVLQAMESEPKKDSADGAPAAAADGQSPLGFEYTLRPILFVIGRGAGPEAIEARKKEAEALRSQFDSCDTGIRYARSLRDVAVREQILKSSSELAPAIREILDKVPVGHLTSPEVTSRGVELFALCNKREARVESVAKALVKNKLMGEKFEAQGKRYLAELRRAALIEWKEPQEPIKEVKGKKGVRPSKESNAHPPGVKTE